MADNAKIKKIIEDSLISPEEKRALVQYMEIKGLDMRFFDTFNKYLVSAAKKHGKKYEEALERIGAAETELDEKITFEKAGIEKSLEEELDSIDPDDRKTKEKVWKKYYQTLDELGERYGKGLREILTKILAT